MRRLLAASALAAVAGIHIALVPDHLREAPYAGALFIALGAAALAIAIRLVVRESQIAYTAGGALALIAILAYAASRSVGLPSLVDDVGDWLNPLGLSSLVCEATTAIVAIAVLAPARKRETRHPAIQARSFAYDPAAKYRAATKAGRDRR